MSIQVEISRDILQIILDQVLSIYSSYIEAIQPNVLQKADRAPQKADHYKVDYPGNKCWFNNDLKCDVI